MQQLQDNSHLNYELPAMLVVVYHLWGQAPVEFWIRPVTLQEPARQLARQLARKPDRQKWTKMATR